MKSKMDILGPARLQEVMFCLQVLADQSLSTEDEHSRVTSEDIVEALQQQADEMVRIDDAIQTARRVLKRVF